MNLSYGINEINFDNAINAGLRADVAGFDKTRNYALINYLWTPTKNIELGTEYGLFQIDRLGEIVNEKAQDSGKVALLICPETIDNG